MPGTNPVPVQFSGVSTNRIVFSPGAVTLGAAFTMAAVIRPATSEGTFRAIWGIENANPGTDQFLLLDNVNEIYVQLPVAAQGNGALTANVWHLVAVTKAAGSSAPRLHRYNFGTPGWVRENTSASTSWSDTIDHLAAGTFNDTSHPFEGFTAVYAFWASVLSDGNLDTMIVSLDAWQALNPVWWAIANGATPMIDETGGTGDETSRGTGVTSGAAQTSPIQWLASDPARNIHFTRTSRGTSW